MAVNIGVNIQRSPNRINQALRDAGVNGQYPKLLFDFNDDYYLTNGSSKALSDVVTFTRNGNATMVDSDGLIKWAPHNLITYSEDFTQWSGASKIISNVAIAPDGTQTADKLFASASAVTQEINFANNFGTHLFTQVIYAKAAEYDYLFINGVASSDFSWFNLANGTLGTISGSHSNAVIQPVGDGWYRCSVDVVGANAGAGFGVSETDGVYYYTGDGSSGIYIWGAHLYRSDLGGMAPLPLSERAFQNDAYYEPDKPAIQAALLRAAVNLEPEKTLFNIEVDGRKLGDVNADGTVSSADALEYTRYVSGDTTYSTYIENVMHPYMVENSATYLAYLDERSSAYYVPTTSSAVYMPRIGHHKYNGDQWVDKGGLFESEARTNLVPYSQETTGWTASSGSFTNNAATAPDGTNTAFLFTASASTAIASARTGTFVSSTGTHSVYIKNNGMDIVSIWIADGNSNPVIFDLTTGTIVSNASQFGSIEDVGNGWYRISNGNTSVSSTQMRIYCGTGSTQTNNGTDGFYLWGAQVEAASTPSSYIPTNGSSVTRAAESITVPYANLPWPTPTYIGDELVTNGTFDTDTSGWTIIGSGAVAWLVSSGSVYSSGQTSFSNYLQQEFTCEIGKIYSVSAEIITQGTNNALVKVGSTQTGGEVGNVWADGDGEGVFTFEFVATSTTHYVTLQEAPGGTSHYYDNISVREINPLSVSIAMQGEMDYADEDTYATVQFYKWIKTADNFINATLTTNSTGTGRLIFIQEYNGDYQQVDSAGQSIYTPNINVPYSVAGRHGSNFLNIGAEGLSYTANTNIDGLPDLSTADFNLAFDYMGTISEFRIWDKDIGDTGIAEATKPSTELSLSLTFDGQPSSFTNTGLIV